MKGPLGTLTVCAREGRATGMVLVVLAGLAGRAHVHLVRMRRGGDHSGAGSAVAASDCLENQPPKSKIQVQDGLPGGFGV